MENIKYYFEHFLMLKKLNIKDFIYNLGYDITSDENKFGYDFYYKYSNNDIIINSDNNKKLNELYLFLLKNFINEIEKCDNCLIIKSKI